MVRGLLSVGLLAVVWGEAKSKTAWGLDGVKQAKRATDQKAIIEGLLDGTCITQLFRESLFNCDGKTRNNKTEKFFEQYEKKAGVYNATARAFCHADNGPQYSSRKLASIVPKAPWLNLKELKSSWARARKLAAQAIFGELKHDPYPAPVGWKRDYGHLDKCVACDVQPDPKQWPKGFTTALVGKQSFIDDYLVESVVGAERIMGEPTQVRWLRGVDDYYGKNPYISVVHDGAKFVMFYPSFHLPEKPKSCSCGIAMATSVDGFQWERPALAAGPWAELACDAKTREEHPNAVHMMNFGVFEDAEVCIT
jgi:hypothetical protein